VPHAGRSASGTAAANTADVASGALLTMVDVPVLFASRYRVGVRAGGAARPAGATGGAVRDPGPDRPDP